MASMSGRLSATGRTPHMPPLARKPLRELSLPIVHPGPPAVFSKYLMNDIPRGTSRAKLLNSLQPVFDPAASSNVQSVMNRPHVDSGCIITDSRLDDELSVAHIEFSDTPKWLQALNQDLYGFPKKTALGTLWRGVDTGTGEIDDHGRSEFIRATIEGNLIYAETLAEFKDTDINVQDNQGRTAIHWACAENHIDLVRLCLSIPECDVGLKDKDELTAFDLSIRDEKMLLPALFYKSMLEMEESHPQTALLRMFTVMPEPEEDRALFPGEAIFGPIEDNNTPLVKALIKRGIDLTSRDTNGDTALHMAAKATNVEFAIRLINAGSDVDAIGNGGDTPLHCAAQKSQKQMVQALLSYEAKPDLRNDQGKRALDLAGDPDMIRYELDRKVNDAESLTPLQRAAEDGDIDILRLLLELGASVDEKNNNGHGQTALMVAASKGHRDVGELLVKAGANIEATDKNGRTPLNLASTEEFLRLLRDCGATVSGGIDTEATEAVLVRMSDIATRTAVDNPIAEDDKVEREEELSAAIEVAPELKTGGFSVEESKGQVHMLPGVRFPVPDISTGGILMEEHNAGTSMPLGVQLQHEIGLPTLLQAVQAGDVTKLRLLLVSGVEIDEKDGEGRTLLYITARDGRTEIVQALLAHGAQTETAPESGATPLYIAADNGHTAIVQALLSSGSHIEAVEQSGATPLYIAAQNGHTQTVKALLAHGAQTEAARVTGATPLFIAARNGHPEIVHALLAGGARTEVTRSSGATPLYIAAYNGHMEIVQALLACGAQTETAHGSGATPLFIAAQNGHIRIVQALLASGAQTEASRVSSGTPLYVAAENGHTEIVRALLANGAQTEAAEQSGATALLIAAYSGHTDTVRALLAGGADHKAKTWTGKTALNLAVANNDKETAKVLKVARGWRASDLTTWVR